MGAALLRVMESAASMKVWQLDPFNLTPYYDAALCAALARAGCTVRWITSPYLYDSAPLAYPADYFYFRSLNHPRWLRYPHLRRAARIVLNLLGHRALVRELDQYSRLVDQV